MGFTMKMKDMDSKQRYNKIAWQVSQIAVIILFFTIFFTLAKISTLYAKLCKYRHECEYGTFAYKRHRTCRFADKERRSDKRLQGYNSMRTACNNSLSDKSSDCGNIAA